MRIIKTIEIEGRPVEALFDTGATHTYVLSDVIRRAPRRRVKRPYRVVLGGHTIRIREVALVLGTIEGLPFDTEAVPVRRLGRADGHDLGAIIGALTMEKWEMRLTPKTGDLDLSKLRRPEFTEY